MFVCERLVPVAVRSGTTCDNANLFRVCVVDLVMVCGCVVGIIMVCSCGTSCDWVKFPGVGVEDVGVRSEELAVGWF